MHDLLTFWFSFSNASACEQAEIAHTPTQAIVQTSTATTRFAHWRRTIRSPHSPSRFSSTSRGRMFMLRTRLQMGGKATFCAACWPPPMSASTSVFVYSRCVVLPCVCTRLWKPCLTVFGLPHQKLPWGGMHWIFWNWLLAGGWVDWCRR